RVRLLTEMFPEARFIHVHRDPYTVFRSTRHLNDVLTRTLQFQTPGAADLDGAVIRRYRQIHDAYFDERGLIPEGHLHELAFGDLERDPVGQIRNAYEALGLGGFGDVLPRLEDHVAGLADYRKNTYPDLPADLKSRIRSEWRRSFEAWDYPTG
ncbi:MAG: sulfotransferase, partial [Planctomycetia bacterium]|nr:sulfotransferase [Planctomycetia bacterium]